MTTTHDTLAIPQHNLLDGREYEQYLAFVYPDDLREGDIITTSSGTYQVQGVGDWHDAPWDGRPGSSGKPSYIRHIRIGHTLAGPIMGGLLCGTELVQVLARRRTENA